MTLQLAATLPLIIVTLFLIWQLTRAIKTNRETTAAAREGQELMKAAENRRQAEQEKERQLAALFGALTGTTPVEPIKITDIKHKDEVCWHSTDGRRHEHYFAGYDGDPGPSTDGIHARPLTPKSL
ncbi:hypothetical protein GCM10009700_31940 [Brevibacterium sanguinis]|uniref:TadE family protein n=1 Tax=Brevibacterium sanguinis TaxID=232444 RepID=UPI0031DBB2E2